MPVVARFLTRLSEEDRARCEAVADSLRPDLQPAKDKAFFEPSVRPDITDGPFVFFGDTGEPGTPRDEAKTLLEYRLALLAGEGDLVVIGGDRDADFEDYLENWLGLERRHYLKVEEAQNGPQELSHVRCLQDEACYGRLRAFVERAGRVTIAPYAATGAIWRLARRLATDTGAPVSVAGSLPTVTAAANNKIFFTTVVRALFGPSAAPREVLAHGPAALAGHVRKIAGECQKLVVKLPESSGSAGNFPVFHSDITGRTVKDLHAYLVDRLGTAGTPTHFPIIVQVWQNSVFTSPSLQLWIPRKRDGPPVVEDVFHQIVTEPEGRFVGAYPANCTDPWIPRFCREGLMLGQVFQDLGFFGRCSFDAVLFGDDPAKPSVQWLECNGRWGGVSIPMTLLNRLFPVGDRPAFVIAQAPQPGLPRRSFSEGLDLVRDLLWKPGLTKGIIFQTPSGFTTGSSLHFVSVAPSLTEANEQAELAVDRLLA